MDPLSAAAGAVVWAQAYDPFGRVVSGLGSDARFAGQWFAAENGLHQNWMRDYDATLGRYIQADPLGLVDGASVYGYALQSPARWSDPRGESIGGVLAAAGGAAIADGPLPFGDVVAGAIIAGAIYGALNTDSADEATDEAQQCSPDGRCSPSQSPVWKSLRPYQGKTKTNGLPGKAKKFYEWDYTHCNIEVYNGRGKHLGAMDPVTGAMVEPPDPAKVKKL